MKILLSPCFWLALGFLPFFFSLPEDRICWEEKSISEKIIKRRYVYWQLGCVGVLAFICSYLIFVMKMLHKIRHSVIQPIRLNSPPKQSPAVTVQLVLWLKQESTLCLHVISMHICLFGCSLSLNKYSFAVNAEADLVCSINSDNCCVRCLGLHLGFHWYGRVKAKSSRMAVWE